MSKLPFYLSYTDATIETTNETLFLIYIRVPTVIATRASYMVYLHVMWRAMPYNAMVGWLWVSCYLTLVKLQCPHIIHMRNLRNAEHRNLSVVKKEILIVQRIKGTIMYFSNLLNESFVHFFAYRKESYLSPDFHCTLISLHFVSHIHEVFHSAIQNYRINLTIIMCSLV